MQRQDLPSQRQPLALSKAVILPKKKDDIIKFYTEKYQQMLAENLEQYIENFDQYTQLAKNNPNPSL